MLTYYTKENIDKIFWAWCSQQQLNHNTIWIHNNITKQEYSIQFKSEINANRFLEMLKQGCLIDESSIVQCNLILAMKNDLILK